MQVIDKVVTADGVTLWRREDGTFSAWGHAVEIPLSPRCSHGAQYKNFERRDTSHAGHHGSHKHVRLPVGIRRP